MLIPAPWSTSWIITLKVKSFSAEFFSTTRLNREARSHPALYDDVHSLRSISFYGGVYITNYWPKFFHANACFFDST